MARTLAHARIQKKKIRGGPTSDNVFMGGGAEDPTSTKRGPSSVHLNDVCWRTDGGPTLNAGLLSL